MAALESFPVDMHGWTLLRGIRKVRLRAVRIDLKGSVTDTDGHLVREAIAEGGVKFQAKRYDSEQFAR